MTEPSVEKIRLKISKDQLSDETLICFNPAASNQFDPAFDAEKLFNGHAECPEIFSMADGHPLCINILAGGPVSVSLGVSYNQEDSLALTAFDSDGIPEETGIFLEDNKEGTWINMREQPVYRFYNNPFTPGSRFILHFMNVAGLTGQYPDDEIKFGSSQNGIFVMNPKNIRGDIFLYSIDGRLLSRFEAGGVHQVIQPDVPVGLYILRFVSQEYYFGGKIFIY